jgi:cell division protein FtsZ
MGLAMMGTGSASGENRAREAAESAISSPLLENINLQGAQGVLVNITAGMNMTIGEFEEVGDVIKSFTSDDAVVVIGTVVDAELGDEMRVTVVATGLGQNTQGVGKNKPLLGSTRSDGTPDYARLDKPTVMRREVQQQARPSAKFNENDESYLDIPAFLRRRQGE